MQDLNLLQQFIARWTAKSPTVFKIISWITGAAAFITGIPELLTTLGVVLPEPFLSFENKTVLVAGLVGLFISRLTVATPVATAKVLDDINAGTPAKVASANA